MGISGLTSLVVENSEQLLRPTVLSNCGLVVDGCNMCHQLYEQSKLDCIFGGEYHKFENVLFTFFKSLLQAKIELLVMWDGSYNKDDAKLQTNIARQKSRILSCVALSHGRRAKVLPLQAYAVFLNVLKSLNIPCCQCLGDADAFIANVANCFGWPVLSEDSDFYIYDLDFGYIPLSRLDWHTLRNGSLNVEIYHVANLLETVPNNFRRNLLPLFAAVCGNDFISAANFSEFVAQLRVPVVSRSQRLRITKKHNQMIALLEWLSEKTLDEAVQKILKCLKSRAARQNGVEKLLLDVIDMYNCHKLDKNVVRCADDVLAVVISDFEKQNLDFPRWFVEAYVCCELNSFFLGITIHKRCYLPCLVEDFSRQSAYVCSTSIRQYLYTILSGFGGTVTEYSRKGMQLAVEQISCSIKENDSSVLCPELCNVSEWSLEQRREVLLTAARFDTKMRAQLQSMPPSDELFILSTVFWLLSSETCVEQTDFLALLIYYTRPVDLAKFDFSANIGTKHTQERHGRLLHVLAQWQTVLDALVLVNNVLLKPMQCPRIAEMYSGRIVFNVAYYLCQRNESLEKTLSNLLKDAPQNSNAVQRVWALRNCIADICKLHYSYSERAVFQDKPQTTAQVRRHRKKRCKRKENCENCPSDGAATTVGPTGDMSDGYEDMENRFHQLSKLC